MAYISISSVSESSITAYMAGLDTGYQYSDRICSWYINGNFDGYSYLDASVSSGGRYTFSGLSAGTTYTIQVIVQSPNMTAHSFSATATTDGKSV